MTVLVFIATLSYVLFGLILLSGWFKATTKPLAKNRQKSSDGISIVIPFRNEINALPGLLNSLAEQLQNFNGQYEVLIVDDHSTDESYSAAESICNEKDDFILIRSSGQGKIKAIESALNISQYDSILSLDADIHLGERWSSALNELVQEFNDQDMVILPVMAGQETSFVGKIAALDFCSLIGATFSFAGLGIPIMANGAQLLYKKRHAQWDQRTVSGDDVFLLHSIKSARGSVSTFLDKDSVVTTQMPNTWQDLIEQRSRWASKANKYTDRSTLVVGWYLMILNVMLWVLFVMSLMNPHYLSLFLSLMVTKVLVDLVYLIAVTKWFNRMVLLWYFPYAWILNSLMFPLIMISMRMFGFTWKGRAYK